MKKKHCVHNVNTFQKRMPIKQKNYFNNYVLLRNLIWQNDFRLSVVVWAREKVRCNRTKAENKTKKTKIRIT